MLPVQVLIFRNLKANGRTPQTALEKCLESEAIPLDEQLLGGTAAEEEIQDLIEGVDEDGNTVMLEVVRYFFYNGEEYVVLGDAQTDEDEAEGDDEEEVNLYIMKVVEKEEDGEELEEFLAVEDEDLLEKLIEVVQADFEADEAFDDE